MGTRDQSVATEASALEAEPEAPAVIEAAPQPVPEGAVRGTPDIQVDGPAAASDDPVEAAVNGWIYEHIANSPVSQHTPAWNYLISKLGALVAAIKGT